MVSVFGHWKRLCEGIETSERVCNDWWAILSRRYGEEWRFYHTMQHIKHLLELFCQWKELIVDLNVIRLAIFFHEFLSILVTLHKHCFRVDTWVHNNPTSANFQNGMYRIVASSVVYDPMAKDNELQSVVLFQKFALDSKLQEDTVTQVSDMIKATISHSVSMDCKDLDLCLFLDFDLAILGTEPEAYEQYASEIRKEYSHLDDSQFAQGRAKVLQSLLKSEQLYVTEELRDIYEAHARANIKKELACLSSQTVEHLTD